MGKTYGIVLAGGIGSRMGNAEKPKQFLDLGGKPIIIHTLEKFVVHPGFDRILVLVPRAWIMKRSAISLTGVLCTRDRRRSLSG